MKERAADEQKAESQKLKQVVERVDCNSQFFAGDGETQGADPKDPRDPGEDGVLLEVLLLWRRPHPHL